MKTISRADIEPLGITTAEFAATLEQAFQAAHEGRITGRPKSTIVQPDGAFFIATHACWPERKLAVFHSIMGVSAQKVPAGAPHYRTMQLLTDYDAASPLALIDGTVTSTILPAAITLLSARRLARKDSKVLALIGAGVQARVNFDALKSEFKFDDVRIFSRTAASADKLAGEIRKEGYDVKVLTNPDAILAGADIIVSTVPGSPTLKPFLDPKAVSPGAYVSAVDLGRSWRIDNIVAFDRILTDDRPQALMQHKEGRMNYGGPFEADLPELIAGTRPARENDGDRIILIHPGNVVGIIGMSALIWDRFRGNV